MVKKSLVVVEDIVLVPSHFKTICDSVRKLQSKLSDNYSRHFSAGLDTVRLNDDQYSYQHIKTLGIHNHLVSDPWCPRAVYYISSQWTVVRSIAQVSKSLWAVVRKAPVAVSHTI